MCIELFEEELAWAIDKWLWVIEILCYLNSTFSCYTTTELTILSLLYALLCDP